MLDRILGRMRECIETDFYRISEHAREKCFELDINTLDVENAILSGTVIERQRDIDTEEPKYVVLNTDLILGGLCVVTKFTATGRLHIITVYQF